MDENHLGSRIRKLRIKRNMTQEMIAQQLGVSRQTIAKWESNQSKPSTNNLIQLASFFEVSLNQMTESAGKKPENRQRFRLFLFSPILLYTGSGILYSLAHGDSLLQTICIISVFIMGILMCAGIWKINTVFHQNYALKLLMFCVANWLLTFILPPIIGNLLTMLAAAILAAFWLRILSNVIEGDQ